MANKTFMILIDQDDFYKGLKDSQIRKSDKALHHLSKIFKKNFKTSFINVTELKKLVDHTVKIDYVLSFGTKKRKMPQNLPCSKYFLNKQKPETKQMDAIAENEENFESQEFNNSNTSD